MSKIEDSNIDKQQQANSPRKELEALRKEVEELRRFKQQKLQKEKLNNVLKGFEGVLDRKPQQTITQWADLWMAKLVPYLKGVQAVMYAVTGTETNTLLQWVSGYATSARAKQRLHTTDNELLVKVAESGEMYEVNLPKGLVLQSAAQMQITPHSLLIYPFAFQETVLGILEIYLLEPLTDAQNSVINALATPLTAQLQTYHYEQLLTHQLEELEQREFVYQNILENSQQAMGLLHTSGELTQANLAFFQLLGYNAKPQKAPNFLDHLPNIAEKKGVQHIVTALMERKRNSQVNQLIIKTLEGDQMKYKFHFSHFHIPQQADFVLIQLLGYSLMRNQKESQFSIEVLNDSMQEMFIFDQHSLQIVFVNTAGLQNCEHSLEVLTGKSFSWLTPQFSQDDFRQIVQSLVETDKQFAQFEMEVRRPDLTFYTTIVRLKLINYKGKPAVLAMMQDVTRRKELERELLLQRDKITKELTRKVEEEAQKLTEDKARIHDINQRIIQQNKIIASKSKDMFDSLQYAKVIQESILPSETSLKKLLKEAFVFYQAKDVVSGDFYWVHEKDHKVFIVAADCTGHGVPGALLTMLGSNLLKEIIKSSVSNDPGEILEQLDQIFTESLQHEEEKNRDGMDLALCVIDYEIQRVAFAGAKRPLYYIQNNQLHKIKGSVRSIVGGSSLNDNPFETHYIDVYQPTSFYVFSDGYQDQFGGPQDKKFLVGRLKKLLLDIYNKPMAEQRQIVDDTMQDWMGKRNQTDDMLVMGFKMSGYK